MLMPERASKIQAGTYLSRDEARAERLQRLKKGAGSEETNEKWYWHPERGDNIEEDPLYSEGVETCKLKRLRYNDELAAKAEVGEITWEEFEHQKKPAPKKGGAGSAAQGSKAEEGAGEGTAEAKEAQPVNKLLTMSLTELKKKLYTIKLTILII